MKQLSLIIFFLLLALPSKNLFSQTSVCLDCHSEKNFAKKEHGKKVSLYVNGRKFTKSVHGEMDCTDCHEDFNAYDLPHRKGRNIAKVDCGACHDEEAAQIKNDIHHRLKNIVGNKAPTCVSCHGFHYVVSASALEKQGSKLCARCHSNVEFKGNYHLQKALPDKSCVDCHEPESTRKELQLSVHSGLACSDCHVYESKNLEKHQEGVSKNKIADCSTCHKQEKSEHNESIHGISLAEGVDEAAACWDCHGSHKILKTTDPGSPVFAQNIPSTCNKCHGEKDFKKKFPNAAFMPVKQFESSVHGELLAKEVKGVANCTSCHTAHSIKNITQPGSSISPFQVPYTCGQCHPDESKEYRQSIHWTYVKMGVKLSPACNDCHSEHNISRLSGKNKRLRMRDLEEQTCIACHENKNLIKRFGLPSDVTVTYLDSYHGMASRRGDTLTALCTDCHNVHKILPKENSASSINPANVKNTCRQCHADATQTFAESYTHHQATEEGVVAMNIVDVFYFWLILLVIGGMILHNMIIYIHEVKKKREFLKGLPSVPRFTQSEVIQHLFLLTSFITLALTGFALRFPDSWWSHILNAVGIHETVRQVIHRVAAVIMVLTGIYHIIYLIITKRGRVVLGALLPRFKDISDAIQNVMYYLGLAKEPPAFDNFDYTEKAEYWALIWGTIVMATTGFFLWFPTAVGNWAPSWLIKVSELIHYYEAILASLAILVWHWFFVIFHPNQYPMSLTWIDGRMSLDEYKHHHKEHFYQVVHEWIKIKKGLAKEEEVSYNTKLFLEYLRKQGKDPDHLFMEQIRNDRNLKNWLEKYFGAITI